MDNSIVVAWLFEDEVNQYADLVMESLVQSVAIVPPVWTLEIRNTLLVAERRNRLSQEDALSYLELLGGLSIQIERDWQDSDLHHLWALAREHQLSSYDASYLDLAIRRGIPIATQDKALRNAAERCDVTMYTPESP